MRAYTASDEETLRIRFLLRDWAGEGLIGEPQHRRLEEQAECGLRRTNIFLRIVLFLFTAISAAAATALFFLVLFQGQSELSDGILFLLLAALSYAGAEFAVSRGRLYRHGIEEALAVLSVGFLCVGLQSAIFGNQPPGDAEFVIPAAGAIASFLIYRRFGFLYAFLAAMIFAAFIPHYWIASHTGQRLIIAGFYAAGLLTVVSIRRVHQLDFADEEYSMVEALLWLGIYLTMNLRLSSMELPALLFGYRYAAASNEFSGPFYWATYVLIWCLPAVILWRGLRCKDHWVARLGVIVSLLTLITNKPYLGWPRHPWDPMLLGILLVGIAVATRRWLAGGPDGIRYGFTAQRFSGRDKQLLNTLAAASGFVSPALATHAPVAGSEAGFGGGSSGGGGASSDY
jgi:hypothetical protein